MLSNLFFGVSINFTSIFKNELPLLYQRHQYKVDTKAHELLNESVFGDDRYMMNVFNKLYKV